jgi:hypothetical protein
VGSRAVLAVLHLLWFAASCGSLLHAATVPSRDLHLEVEGLGHLASFSDTRQLALVLAGLSVALAALWLLVSVLVRRLGVRLMLLVLLWFGWLPLLGAPDLLSPGDALDVRVRVGEPGEDWLQIEHHMCP